MPARLILALLTLLVAMWVRAGVPGVVTGASKEPVYAKEPLHMKGFAWDFRSYIFPDPIDAGLLLAARLGMASLPGAVLTEMAPLFAGAMDSPEAAEGRSSFLEKRKPHWYPK